MLRPKKRGDYEKGAPQFSKSHHPPPVDAHRRRPCERTTNAVSGGLARETDFFLFVDVKTAATRACYPNVTRQRYYVDGGGGDTTMAARRRRSRDGGVARAAIVCGRGGGRGEAGFYGGGSDAAGIRVQRTHAHARAQIPGSPGRITWLPTAVPHRVVLRCRRAPSACVPGLRVR